MRRRLDGLIAGVAVVCLALGTASASATAQRPPAARSGDAIGELPLHTMPAKGANPMALAVMLSGDGGWAGIDKRITEVLASHGVAVVGLDTRSYLMKARTPDEASADIERVIRHYTAQWSVQRVAVVGYSRGADIAPFIVNRLPAPLREQIVLVALLGPAERANFQFHWADLLSDTSRPSDIPILPELERLRGTPVLCVYGKDEKETLCRLADTGAVRVDQRAGHHHFDGDYDAIAIEILRLLAPLDANGR
jgi:type IV secretory pathway VirJ component